MDLSGKRVVVIGGGGFIGSHVVEELLKTPVKDVVVYDNFTRGSRWNLEKALADKRVSIFPAGGDIRDVDVLDSALSHADGVVHLAAMWLLHCQDYPRTAFDVNVQGTFNVLEACVRNGVERVVYSSSASVYGDAVESPMSESHPFNNRNFYGATKISGEAMFRAYFERYGLRYVGLRYMNVYGPRQPLGGAYSGVIPSVLERLAAGEGPVVNGDGTQSYDFVSVVDAAKCNVLALESDECDEFFNVGTGIQTSVKELCDILVRLSGLDVQVEFRPYSQEDQRGLVQTRVGSVAKAESRLAFRARIALEDGLKQMLDHFGAGSDSSVNVGKSLSSGDLREA